MAQAILEALRSGLSLITDLAGAFLNGFTALFWDSTNSALTTFGSFALIMLSVAIVFAVIKLVLNIVRSNTGV